MDLPIVGPYFFAFILIWTYMRHYINLCIIYSMLPLPLPDLTRWLVSLLPVFIATNPSASPFLEKIQQPVFPRWNSQFASVGPYELNWDTQQYKCWIAQWITCGLLVALQSVNLFWLFFIVRIAYRFVLTDQAVDERSEAESEDEEVPIQKVKSAQADEARTPEPPTMMLNGAPMAPSGNDLGGKRPQPTTSPPRKKTAKSR